ncbi:MAG: universal stress protein [Bryobacterales bacterium]|nr:universal stress protein [Bryobacterales bacterium]
MLSLESVLLPVNFSDRCDASAQYARYLADRAKTRIVLLHVLEDVPYEFASMEFSGVALHDLVVERRKQAETQLRDFATRHFSGVNLEVVLLEGDPATRIVEKAHEVNASAILMPTHGYGRFRRFILGSTTAKVLHDADVPVWTGVHMEEALDHQEIQHILCAIDLGDASERVASWASNAAKEMGAALTVVHVVPHLEHMPGEYFERDWEVQVKNLVTKDLEKLLAGKAESAEIIVEGGDPADTICETARTKHADLVVIGRGTASGIFGRMRAHAYEIIRESPCPVVSV